MASDERLLAPVPVVVPEPVPVKPTTDKGLTQRLLAIHTALADIPRQAERMVRWEARQALKPKAKFREPLRTGRPPGWHRNGKEEVDHILTNCHALAFDRTRLNST